MKILMERVEQHNHPMWEKIEKLYLESFPADERRTTNQLESLLTTSQMKVLVIKDEEDFIGFMILWDFSSFVFLEHFAIETNLQGRNYGSKALKSLELEDKKVLFEVEYATDSQSEKRISFYRKNGFVQLTQPYAQPPYQKNGRSIPMHLFSNSDQWSASELEHATTIIRDEVYFRFW